MIFNKQRKQIFFSELGKKLTDISLIILKLYIYFWNVWLDLLWSLLRGDQPLQALPYLHQQGGQDVHRQEEEWGEGR